jgi:serine/alanine adding enzyme
MAVTTETKNLEMTRAETPLLGWGEYLTRSSQANLYHDPAWAGLIRSCFGHRTFFLAAQGKGALRGILPLVYLKSRIFGKALVSMPYFNYGGLLADDDAAVTELIASAVELKRELGADYIELRQSATLPSNLPVKSHKVIMLLPLPSDPEALLRNFKSKLRNQIRTPEKAGATFHWGGRELLDEFYGVFAENMRDLGTPVYSKLFFKAIVETFPAHCHIAVIRLSDQPVAAGFLLGFRGKLEIPWASSVRRYNRFSPNMLLYSGVLRQAILEGFQVFDFGRSTLDSGTYRFKQQWGAAPSPTYWYYPGQNEGRLPEHNPESAKFYWATQVWKRLPLAFTNRLGPAIVKNIP